MKRILITGGAGFLGSHLCDRFIKEGYHVMLRLLARMQSKDYFVVEKRRAE